MTTRPGSAPDWLVTAASGTGSALEYGPRCECELCREGVTTALHADSSHDHRWSQTFALASDPAGAFTLEGGTSKSARALLGFLLAHPHDLVGRRVLELGAGAGLVSIGLARCGADVGGWATAILATDQEPVVPMLSANVATHTSHLGCPRANAQPRFRIRPWARPPYRFCPLRPPPEPSVHPPQALRLRRGAVPRSRLDLARPAISVQALTWGDPRDLAAARSFGPELVLGADLNFARENMAPLLSTVMGLAQPGTTVILASVRRARWEAELDTTLSARFAHTHLAAVGEVSLDRYEAKGPPRT